MRRTTHPTFVGLVLFCVSLWAPDSALQGQNSPGNSAAPNQNASASASLAGAWTITVDSRARGPLIIKQDGTKITGTIDLHDGPAALQLEGTVDGGNLHFTAKRNDGVVEDYSGTLQRSGEWMGLRNDSDGKRVKSKWTAFRAARSS